MIANANTNANETTSDLQVDVSNHEVVITRDDRRYRIRGLERNTSPMQMRVNILAKRDDLVHLDTLDLAKARSRVSFRRSTGSWPCG